MRAEPIPIAATNLLEQSADIIRTLSEEQENITDTLERLEINDNVSNINIKLAIDAFKLQLQEALGDNIDITQIWAFGPRKCGPNILLNKIPSK